MQRSVQARKRARSGDGLCLAGIHVRIISKNVASWIDTGSLVVESACLRCVCRICNGYRIIVRSMDGNGQTCRRGCPAVSFIV
jgi:hypothetical protein